MPFFLLSLSRGSFHPLLSLINRAFDSHIRESSFNFNFHPIRPLRFVNPRLLLPSKGIVPTNNRVKCGCKPNREHPVTRKHRVRGIRQMKVSSNNGGIVIRISKFTSIPRIELKKKKFSANIVHIPHKSFQFQSLTIYLLKNPVWGDSFFQERPAILLLEYRVLSILTRVSRLK